MGARRFRGLILGLVLVGAAGLARAGTLDEVRQRGSLTCGVSQGLAGFSERNAKGEWSGFDVDFCRAVAAAIFKDPAKVTYVPLSPTERFEALRDRKIDLLSRNSTWTFEREAGLGLLFAGIAYHDGQGFLALRRPATTSALELGGATVCVQDGTSTRANLADFFKANAMSYREELVSSPADAVKALDSGRCDVFTADQSALYVERLNLAKPEEATILPDVISKEPLGPVVRADDIGWFNVVRWTLHALIDAEDLGIGTTTADEAAKSAKPDVRRFVGTEGGLGKLIGLENGWALQAVRAVGNYGEMFEGNIGSRSRFGVPRGLNQLWSNGGILYAPPLK